MEQITSCLFKYCSEMHFVLEESVLDSGLNYDIFQLCFLQNNKLRKEALVRILK